MKRLCASYKAAGNTFASWPTILALGFLLLVQPRAQAQGGHGQVSGDGDPFEHLFERPRSSADEVSQQRSCSSLLTALINVVGKSMAGGPGELVSYIRAPGGLHWALNAGDSVEIAINSQGTKETVKGIFEGFEGFDVNRNQLAIRGLSAENDSVTHVVSPSSIQSIKIWNPSTRSWRRADVYVAVPTGAGQQKFIAQGSNVLVQQEAGGPLVADVVHGATQNGTKFASSNKPKNIYDIAPATETNKVWAFDLAKLKEGARYFVHYRLENNETSARLTFNGLDEITGEAVFSRGTGNVRTELRLKASNVSRLFSE